MASSAGRTCGVPPRVTIVLAAVFLVWAASGCTTIKDAARSTARALGDTSRKVADTVTPGTKDPKHTIAVIGMESQFGPSRIGFDTHFVAAMSERLHMDCRALRVDGAVSALLASPPRLPSGRIDGFEMGALGRARGVEYVTIGTLNGLTFQDAKTGFWWWKGTRYSLRVSLRLEIVDTASGTKLLDEPFADVLELDENRYELLKEAPIPPLEEILPAVKRILRDAGERTCEALKDQPWQGFITAAADGRVTLSSGSSAGLAPGTRLEVFAPGRLMQSKEGQRFLKPGDKVGQAEVISVEPDRAVALLAKPQPELAGGVVRLK